MVTDAAGALATDLYELTMAAALLEEGRAEVPVTFSLFVRALPPDRGYLVAAGLEDVLSFLESFRFTPDDLDALATLAPWPDGFLDHLAGLRFAGHVRAVPEGRIVFAQEPLLEVEAPFAVAQLVETFLLNQVTYQTALATKGARCVHAAGGRPVVDFGFRRTHGVEAGLRAARAGAIVGFAGTSNVAAAVRYGLAATGTMAHAFVQAHVDETDAFRAFAGVWGDATVLLVDTYDTPRGVDRAIQVGLEMAGQGRRLRGVRLDSGDLVAHAKDTRARLDAAGLHEVRIVASGGLDEHDLEALARAGAPIDAYGVGTQFGVSADAPTLDTAYKLVDVDGRPVRKRSEGKHTWPGAKQVWRGDPGTPDVLGLVGEVGPAGGRPLLVEVMHDGTRTAAGRATLADAQAAFAADWEWLAPDLKGLRGPFPSPVEISDGLRSLTEQLDAKSGTG